VKFSPFSKVRRIITPRIVPGRLGFPFLNIAIPINTAAIELSIHGDVAVTLDVAVLAERYSNLSATSKKIRRNIDKLKREVSGI
jgi:cell division protein FtsB